MKKPSNRIIELDILKGVAVILMVLFHFLMVAQLENKKIVNTRLPYIVMMAIISHTIFIYVVGINLHISYTKYSDNDKITFYKKQLKRGFKLLIFGGFMTLMSYLLYPSMFVRFGIFHFLGISIILSFLFVQTKVRTTIGIVLFTLLAMVIKSYKYDLVMYCSQSKNVCFDLGVANFFNSLDHFPIIPYFLYILLGIKTGQYLYSDLPYKTIIPSIQENIIAVIGRKSLEIYLIHWFVIYWVVSLL